MADEDFLAEDEPAPRICFERVVPPHLVGRAAELAVRENEANRPHLVGATPSEAAALTGKMWAPGRTLRIKFLRGDPTVQAKVRRWAEVWTTYVNLQFQWVGPGEPADIRIDASYNPADGSWSDIGTDALLVPPDQPTMRLGWLLPGSSDQDYSSVVLHEFGHGAIALVHEHQSPAGGIPWNKPNVYQDLGGPPNNWDRPTIDLNMFQKYAESQTQFSVLDPASIMMYSIPSRWTLNGFSVGWNTSLSPIDIQFSSARFPKPKVPAPPAPQPAPQPAADILVLAVGARPRLGTITVAGGRDVYRITIPRAGRYLISAINVASAWPFIVELHGAVYPSPTPFGRAGSMTVQLTAGTQYVAVRSSNARGTGQYALSVRDQGR